jgi:hypothetical protein
MVIREESELFGTAKITPPKPYLTTAQNKYDSLLGFDRETNTVSPNSALISSPNKYADRYGLSTTNVPIKSTTTTETKPKDFLGYEYAQRPA